MRYANLIAIRFRRCAVESSNNCLEGHVTLQLLLLLGFRLPEPGRRRRAGFTRISRDDGLLMAERDLLLVVFDGADPLDPNLFFQHEPSFDGQNLLHDWRRPTTVAAKGRLGRILKQGQASKLPPTSRLTIEMSTSKLGTVGVHHLRLLNF